MGKCIIMVYQISGCLFKLYSSFYTYLWFVHGKKCAVNIFFVQFRFWFKWMDKLCILQFSCQFCNIVWVFNHRYESYFCVFMSSFKNCLIVKIIDYKEAEISVWKSIPFYPFKVFVFASFIHFKDFLELFDTVFLAKWDNRYAQNQTCKVAMAFL